MRHEYGTRAVTCAMLVVCAYFAGFGTDTLKAQGLQDAIQQQQQILRQQEERRQEQLRQLREREPAKADEADEKQEDIAADQSKVCIKVREIRFEGAELLETTIQAQISMPSKAHA